MQQQPLTSPMLDLFVELCAIPSPSGEERAVADRVRNSLEEIGLSVEEDDAGKRTDGTTGNLLSRLPATTGGVPIFLCAHTDTVPPEATIEPVVEDGVVRNAAGTILGSDNKAAVVVMLGAVPLTTALADALVAGSGEQLIYFRSWIMEALQNAGKRAILIGVALGTVSTGIKIILGIERPYGRD